MTVKKPIHPPVPITIAGQTFPTMTAAARAFNVNVTTIRKRFRTGSLDELVLATPASGDAEPIVIRGVTYPTHASAAEALGVSRSALSKAKLRGTVDRLGLRRAKKDQTE